MAKGQGLNYKGFFEAKVERREIPCLRTQTGEKTDVLFFEIQGQVEGTV